MANLPEVGTGQLPARPDAAPPLFGRPPSFGVAADLERMKQGTLPPRPPRPPKTSVRGRPATRASDDDGGGPWRRFRRWAASRDSGPGDLWHRVACHYGHHDMRGGHQVQLGSRFVHVERRCQWCGAPPG